jgi:hypothetical protein
MLPPDLRAAEQQALEAVLQALTDNPRGRWSVDWRFQGLRLLPPVLRLSEALRASHTQLSLLFPDAGAAALARRDAPEQAEWVADFRGHQRRQQTDQDKGLDTDQDTEASSVLLAVAPNQADYEDFEKLCAGHRGAVVVINGSLEDAAVGIGSVARERRRGFLAQWQAAYYLQPLDGAALRRAFPGPWELFRQDADGFRLAASFDQKPDGEQQAEALATSGGLAGNLRAMDAFIEGLRS